MDELRNANFIQSNYKPSYRAYKVKYKDEKGELIKIIIDIEISGEVYTKDIENPEIVNKYGKNIIIISERRKLKKINKNINLGEYKESCINDKNSMLKLRIIIPNEKCFIGKLYKKNLIPKKIYIDLFIIFKKKMNLF